MMADGFKVGLERRIEALKAERGDQVSIAEVGEVVASIMATVQGDITPIHLRVYTELDDLATYIDNARAEISALCPDDIRQSHLPAATDQLDAIVQHTEEATDTILDAVEKIETEAGKFDSPLIIEQVTRIFEACGFQDITGQRISKIVATLKFIEQRLDRFVGVFGDEIRRGQQHMTQSAEEGSNRESDSPLLQGPQLSTDSNKQEDIDALLASLD